MHSLCQKKFCKRLPTQIFFHNFFPFSSLVQYCPVPLGLKTQGWRKKSVSIEMPPAFSAPAGPRSKELCDTELGAFEKVIGADFLPMMVKAASDAASKKELDIRATSEDAIRLICSHLAMGLMPLRRVKHYWKGSTLAGGLFRNEFFSNLLSYEEYIWYSKSMLLNRSEATEWFNETSFKLWVPFQFVSHSGILLNDFTYGLMIPCYY
jgi:hypothetical protein